ncbi:MAG: response regulator transcription factor [Acidiferrobacterales bacterium]
MSDVAISQSLTTKEVFNFMESLASVEEMPEVDTFRKSTLRCLMDLLRASQAAFYLVDSKSQSINLDTGLGYGIDFSSLRTQYRQHFEQLDPFRQHAVEKVGVTLLSEVVSEQSFVKGEFYNDFLKQQDILHALNISLTANGDCIGVVALCRSASEPDFTLKDKAKAICLRPYLNKALRRRMTYEHANELSWLLSTSLQGLDHVGVILLDRNLNEVYSNTAARHLLSSFNGSSGSSNSLITGDRITLPEPLISFCQQQFHSTYSDVNTGTEISSLIINSGRTSIRVKVKKVSGRFFGEQKQYLCMNIHCSEEPPFQLSLSRATEFRLTAREIEVVQAIAKGSSNAQIGEDLFISCNTVKNHLKNIFAKVGVRNRTELFAVLLARH